MPIAIETNSQTHAEKAANQVRINIRSAYKNLASATLASVKLIWENAKATPQDILNACGNDAAELFGIANAAVEIMNTYGGQNIQTLVPSKYSVTVNPDGTVAITENMFSSSSSSGSA